MIKGLDFYKNEINVGMSQAIVMQVLTIRNTVNKTFYHKGMPVGDGGLGEAYGKK